MLRPRQSNLFRLNDEGIAELLEGEPPRSAGDGPMALCQGQIDSASPMPGSRDEAAQTVKLRPAGAKSPAAP
jgi:hypothetical protein